MNRNPGMVEAGLDINEPDRRNVEARRQRKGECPTCGTKTHKVSIWGKKTPLSIEGSVLYGQCLTCRPIEGYIARPPAQQQQLHQHQQQQLGVHPGPMNPYEVPRTLDISRYDEDDARSLVSAITMDQRLIQGAREFDHGISSDQYDSDDDYGQDVPIKTRPGPSLSGDDPYADGRPDPGRRDRSRVPHNGYSQRPPPREMPSQGQLSRRGRDHLQHRKHPFGGGYGVDQSHFSNRLPPSLPKRGGEGGGGPLLQSTPPSPGRPSMSRPPIHNDERFQIQEGYAWEPHSNHMPPLPSQGRPPRGNPALPHVPPVRGPSAPNGLDADGYPISDGGYGWNKTNDLLPPDGIDGLFQNRVGEGTTTTNHPSRAAMQAPAAPPSGQNEIAFEPRSSPPLSPRANDSISPRLNARLSASQPLADDGPLYQQPEPTGGHRYHDSGRPPMYQDRDGGQMGRISHDAGPSYQLDDSNDTSGDKKPVATGRREQHLRGSLLSHDTTVAPPLLNRDMRGRPDDDSIHDPMNMLPTSSPMVSHEAATSQSPKPVHLMGGNDAPSPSLQRATTGRDGTAPPMPTLGRTQTSASPRRARARTNHEQFVLQQQQQQILQRQEILPGNRPEFAREDSQFDSLDAQEIPLEASARDPGAPASADEVRAMYRRLSETPGTRGRGAEGESEQRTRLQKRKSQNVRDIPTILECLQLDKANSLLRERAFECLAEIVWKSGNKAKRDIAHFNGIDTLVHAMWADMGDANVQDAAFEFLLSLAGSIDASSENDILTNDSVTDALFVSMQTHSKIENIQLRGCGILTCLAAASGGNKEICDGTQSEAISMVLKAMQVHSTSEKIQKAGLQALYSQCLLSQFSVANKRRIMETRVDREESCLDIVTRAVETLLHDLVSLEWACRFLWCLTTSEDIAKTLTESPHALRLVLICYDRYHQRRDAGGLAEAVFGVIGNLSHFESVHSAIHDVRGIPMLLDGMSFHRNDVGANAEACAALANLAVSPHFRDEIFSDGGVGVIMRALQAFSDRVEVVEEALRALLCLTIDSEEAKRSLGVPHVIKAIALASEMHGTSAIVQEMAASLIASLGVAELYDAAIFENGGIETVVHAFDISIGGDIGTSAKENVALAACTAYRNLSWQLGESDAFLSSASADRLVEAMAANERSIAIQMNGCCALWNLAYKAKGAPGAIVDKKGIQCIVKAMQSNIESGDLLEMACGALWSLIDASVDRKQDVVDCGAIDAVACVFLVHPEKTSILEKACGVFSSVSTEPSLAPAVSQAQGLSIVVEAMRNSNNAIDLLEIGANVLRNLVIQLPDSTDEAAGAISTIINAMKENPNAGNLHREACSMLWMIAAQSEDCLSKILALDGVSVLMQTLDHHSDNPDVREVALGAFSQIATDTS